MAATDYQYSLLVDPKNMIRLLELLPSTIKWSAIRITLQAVLLNDAPDYEALSYTWGDEKPIYQISCDGEAFAIRPNLLHALKRLRYRTKSRVLWIDAICIDQISTNTNNEKNHQIPLMRRIYPSASRVLVWLGEEANNSSMGMAMMKKISKIDEDDFDGVSRAILLPESSGSFFVPAAVKQYFDELIDDDSDLYGDSDDETCLEILPQVPSVACNIVGKIVIGIFAPEDPRSEMSSDDESIIGINRLSDVYLPPHGSTAWAALRALINRPWFSRIWVIQEVAVAEKALVICGKDVLSWKVVERAAEVMMAASFPDDAGGRSWMNIVTMKGAGTVYRDEESGEEDTNDIRSHGLLKLLTSTLHTNASDPKDKIFGLYGLLPESTAPKPPSVNYDTSVEILYRDVARFLIEEDNHLIVLQMQGVERKLKKLPSWVPDWSVPTNFASIIAPPDDDDDDQGSDIKLRAIIKKSDNPDELILGAKRLGVVVWAGKAVKQCASEKETKHSMEAALEDWVAFTAGALNMAPGTPGEDKAETFWRTIIANTDGSMDELPKNIECIVRLGLLN
ncbi:hypothetical protein BDZ45DRAFT_679801 [Acephala macrosclerotiorum]|nr:hypothetical protein BDZ45DRAFT_679801 [Acephala macrosclerotiorum]